jgi:hypothetical protein
VIGKRGAHPAPRIGVASALPKKTTTPCRKYPTPEMMQSVAHRRAGATDSR